jgi:hypothetical protein
VDSDGDGLSDEVESAAKLKMSPELPDSDDDGYGDLLEHRLLADGFDPGLPSKPADACAPTDRDDGDGDGLNACEERALGTDPAVIDTDRDRIPDGLELRWGTDPLVIDDKDDLDLDGKFSGEEILAHTDPAVADPEVYKKYRYSYTINQKAGQSSSGKCFDFSVRGVRLATTAARGGAGTPGYNHILVYFGEAPTDIPQDYGNFKMACVRAQYVSDGEDTVFKAPADSKVTLEATDFMQPSALLEALAKAEKDSRCAKSPPDPSCPDPCKGVPLP